MIKQLTLLTGGLLLTLGVRAQSIGPATLNAAGGSASVGGNTYEWSIGEMTVVSTYSSAGLVVTQGVLQPVTTTGIAGRTLLLQNLQVYPSPASQILYLQPDFRHSGTMEYALYDIAGKKVLVSTVALSSGNERQTVNIAALAAGQYMLQVQWLQAGKVYANAFKIQKIQ